jgi:1-acyl-sn-glycerol-3-phosphate acyltransferase
MLMSWIQVGVRVVLIVLLTSTFSILLLTGTLLTAPWPRTRVRWRGSVFKTWSRLLLAVLGVEVETVGEPPDLPFFMVSNHLSYLDIPVLASRVGVVFISKSEIARWPLVGLVCKIANTIFIDREARRDIPRVMQLIHRELNLGAGIILFPEGTSSKGSSVLPFRTSLLEVAARSAMPVSIAALSYDLPEGGTSAHQVVCWWGGMPFEAHLLKLLAVRRIHAKVVFSDQQLHDTDRKQLALRLHRALLENFEPTAPETD